MNMTVFGTYKLQTIFMKINNRYQSMTDKHTVIQYYYIMSSTTPLNIFPMTKSHPIKIEYNNLLKLCLNRPVSHSNGWPGPNMKWRLMRAN